LCQPPIQSKSEALTSAVRSHWCKGLVPQLRLCKFPEQEKLMRQNCLRCPLRVWLLDRRLTQRASTPPPLSSRYPRIGFPHPKESFRKVKESFDGAELVFRWVKGISKGAKGSLKCSQGPYKPRKLIVTWVKHSSRYLKGSFR